MTLGQQVVFVADSDHICQMLEGTDEAATVCWCLKEIKTNDTATEADCHLDVTGRLRHCYLPDIPRNRLDCME